MNQRKFFSEKRFSGGVGKVRKQSPELEEEKIEMEH
jgi:hypothetical protein